jgi:probable phosphoglycerate mutase
MTLLYLVRHGETDWNLQRRIQGSTDIPLNDTGRLQAARTGALLARRHWDGVLSSPLSRAFETASIISDTAGLPGPVPFEAIVERAYGDAEGLTDAELSLRFPPGSTVPGRESREEVASRVIPALIGVAQQHPGKRLIVTTHGGVIRTVLNTVAPGSPVHRGIPISNGSIHSFRLKGRRLELMAFDDPIEVASVEPGASDLSEQNAIEQREAAGEA